MNEVYMNSILDVENNKSKCQKFTPPFIVENMLDIANYNTNLMGKKVLENSFGSGNILKSIIKRYIIDSINNGVSLELISKGIENDIYGIELDENLYSKCIFDLNEIIKEYKLPEVKWSLYNVDALEWDNPVSFQFIIGNPPYISYRYIDHNNRMKLKNKYQTCSKGKFDYCYAFIESAVKMLAPDGKLVQLIPTNIYKNVFAKNLRTLLLPHIVSISEYPNKRIFGSTMTSSSIFLFDNESANENINYINNTVYNKMIIPKNTLTDKWIFSNHQQNKNNLVKFGDFFQASISVATQLNKAFLVGEGCDSIEKSLLKKAASPRTLRYGVNEYIIFPYYYDRDIIKNYTEEEFFTKFPQATSHLSKYKEQLLRRDSDPKAKWFEYGRSQALEHLNQNKLLLSTVVTKRVEVYKLDEETVPYSGIYITIKDPKYTLDYAFKLLTSYDFLEYVENIGISVSGNSKRITCKDINNYEFMER